MGAVIGKAPSVGQRQLKSDTQGFCCSNFETYLNCKRVVMASEKRGSPASHPMPALAPSSSVPTPSKVISAS